MMHRCSSTSHGNMAGQCSCGLYHSQTNSSSFSMLFASMPNQYYYENDYNYNNNDNDMYYSSSSSSVDCTLSLGTPSTRLSSCDTGVSEKRRSSCMSNFGWNILQSKNSNSTSSSTSSKSHRGSGNNNNSGGGGGADPLVARRCANCDTTSTPLWRNGPRGPKSLCNACGIRFKKEERRATAAAATNGGAAAAAHGVVDTQHMINSSWVHHHQYSQAQKMPCYSTSATYSGGNEFRFVDDDDRDASDTAIPFLSWRLNVTDRPSLVHDFTR